MPAKKASGQLFCSIKRRLLKIQQAARSAFGYRFYFAYSTTLVSRMTWTLI